MSIANGTPYPGVCIEMTDLIRSQLCRTCQDCNNNLTDAPILTFDFYNGVSVDIFRMSLTSLVPIPIMYGCPDLPGEEYGPGVGCGGVCQGCDCLCTTMDFIITKDNETTVETAFLSNNVYTSTSGYAIAVIGLPPDCGCALKLVGFGPTNPRNEPAPIAIGFASSQPCPSPFGSFNWQNYGDDVGAGTVTLDFYCKGCGDVPTSVGTTCCENRLPVLLQAELIMDPDCSPPDNGVTDLMIAMPWDPTLILWQGTYQVTQSPGFPYAQATNFTLTMGCTDYGHLVMRLQSDSLGIDQSVAQDGFGDTCDPFETTFSFVGLMTGTACGGPQGSNPYSITVKVMG
jgi:hypothetical protein